ncbi:hypothetical protein BT63DRAFT_188275 [Microthyrium microscopicum]|uniref:Uncharacterized protein n=1 Tax=Microthyrium microscopicum TaxID=703497 RepID=A0A6A6UK58_9PEZI|nr:hypothetical protein BT63DRAFT_188275 [Microthyrium microscopicum]
MLSAVRNCLVSLLPLMQSSSSPNALPKPGTKAIDSSIQPTIVYPGDAIGQAVITQAPPIPRYEKRGLNSFEGWITTTSSQYAAIYCLTNQEFVTNSQYARCCDPTVNCPFITACQGSVLTFNGGSTSACANACVTHRFYLSYGAATYWTDFGCNTAFGDLYWNSPPAPSTATTTKATTSTIIQTAAGSVQTIVSVQTQTPIVTQTITTANNAAPPPNTPTATASIQPSTITVVATSQQIVTAGSKVSTIPIVYTTLSAINAQNGDGSATTSSGSSTPTLTVKASNTPTIIGASVGGAVGALAISLLALLFCCRKRRASKRLSSATNSTAVPTPILADTPYANTHYTANNVAYKQPNMSTYPVQQPGGPNVYAAGQYPVISPAASPPPGGYAAHGRTPSELSAGSPGAGYAQPVGMYAGQQTQYAGGYAPPAGPGWQQGQQGQQEMYGGPTGYAQTGPVEMGVQSPAPVARQLGMQAVNEYPEPPAPGGQTRW